MTLGIDPKVDYAFKWLFGNQKNRSILIHLLHAILNPTPEEQIVEIQILNPFNDKMALDEKLSILDIKARDQLGRQFNIEMSCAMYSHTKIVRLIIILAEANAQTDADVGYRYSEATDSILLGEALYRAVAVGPHLRWPHDHDSG